MDAGSALHRVRCVEIESPVHGHVIAVETEADDGPVRWRTVEVIDAIRVGAAFVIGGPSTVNATLEPAVCASCPRITLTVPPGVPPAPTCG